MKRGQFRLFTRCELTTGEIMPLVFHIRDMSELEEKIKNKYPIVKRVVEYSREQLNHQIDMNTYNLKHNFIKDKWERKIKAH